jgi:ribosomal protein L44E
LDNKDWNKFTSHPVEKGKERKIAKMEKKRRSKRNNDKLPSSTNLSSERSKEEETNCLTFVQIKSEMYCAKMRGT